MSSTDDTQALPSQSITADNLSPLVSIVTWVTMSVALLAALTKVSAKWAITRRQEADDAYVAAATLVTIAFDVAVSSAANFGLGQHASALSQDDLINLQKSLYASDILYVVSICLSKMPILHVLRSLAREATRLRMVQFIMVLNLVVMLVAVFCAAFQCSVPGSWEILSSQKCFNRRAFWDFFGSMDALIDILMVITPIYLLHDLHIRRDKKISAVAAFAVRIITVPLVVLRLVFLANVPDNSSITTDDAPFSATNALIVTSVHANVSIVAACIPFFKPIMDAMQSGIMNLDLRTLNPAAGVTSLPYSSGSREPSGHRLKELHGASSISGIIKTTVSAGGGGGGGKKSVTTTTRAVGTTTISSPGMFARADSVSDREDVGRGGGGGGGEGKGRGRNNSSESRQKMIIKAETTIQVETEDERGGTPSTN